MCWLMLWLGRVRLLGRSRAYGPSSNMTAGTRMHVTAYVWQKRVYGHLWQKVGMPQGTSGRGQGAQAERDACHRVSLAEGG